MILVKFLLYGDNCGIIERIKNFQLNYAQKHGQCNDQCKYSCTGAYPSEYLQILFVKLYHYQAYLNVWGNTGSIFRSCSICLYEAHNPAFWCVLKVKPG